MTAYNINVEQFIQILMNLRDRGVQLMNLDMTPDESNPKMNKLIIHPNENSVDHKPSVDTPPEDFGIQDPDLEIDDIFNLFNKAL